MTDRRKLFLPFVLSIVFLAGCNSSTSPPTPGSMTATVNGSAWSSTVIPGVSGGSKAYRNGNILTVTGLSSTLTQITIEIYSPKVGTDSLGISGDNAAYSRVIAVNDTLVYSSLPSLDGPFAGAATITAFDTVNKFISGQFHFVGRRATNLSDTVTVTNGSFYQVGW